MAKHIMLSYQWDVQELAKKVYAGLKAAGFPVWMDIEGGMSGNINDSMAYGVDNAACVCCFMSPKYQDSKNCKKELNYADAQEVEIVPVMTVRGYKASGWLGLITAGLLWIDFRAENNLKTRIESLAKEIMHKVGNLIEIGEAQPVAAEAEAAPSPSVTQKKHGRAFIHKLTRKFLAESGQVKFHPASGSRNSLVLRDTDEKTSYWVEERKGGKHSEIVFYKNYATDGYLGYDPNGDYVYTKVQHYGAEEWLLKVDDTDDTGRRAVVIFANYGKKYLAIKGGKLTGVSELTDDCRWYLD